MCWSSKNLQCHLDNYGVRSELLVRQVVQGKMYSIGEQGSAPVASRMLSQQEYTASVLNQVHNDCGPIRREELLQNSSRKCYSQMFVKHSCKTVEAGFCRVQLVVP